MTLHSNLYVWLPDLVALPFAFATGVDSDTAHVLVAPGHDEHLIPF